MPHTLTLTRTYPNGTAITATATADDLPHALNAIDVMAERHNARQKAAECAQRASEPKSAPAAPPAPESASAELVALRSYLDARVLAEVRRVAAGQTLTWIAQALDVGMYACASSIARLERRYAIMSYRAANGVFAYRAADTSLDEDVIRLLDGFARASLRDITSALDRCTTDVRASLARLCEAGRVHTDSTGCWCRTLGKIVQGTAVFPLGEDPRKVPVTILYDTP
jgi:hypothetical protein